MPTIYMLQATKHTAAAGYGFRESPESSEVMKLAAGGGAACALLRAGTNVGRNSESKIQNSEFLAASCASKNPVNPDSDKMTHVGLPRFHPFAGCNFTINHSNQKNHSSDKW
jgi:hypothetical protein